MLIVVLKIDGVAMDKTPMRVVEEYVLSPKLHRAEKEVKQLPIEYKHEEEILGEPIITVEVIEGEQILTGEKLEIKVIG